MRQYTSPYYLVVRSKIVLLATQGLENRIIAEKLSLPRQIVSKWRKRFFEQRLEGLEDQSRSGRPTAFSPLSGGSIKAPACELPGESGLALSRFSAQDIAPEVVSRGIAATITNTTVWRWLNADAIRPWRFRSWIFHQALNFEIKAKRALDLYHGRWQDRKLNVNEYVISADEKTSIRPASHPPKSVPAADRYMPVEHEYQRKGALNYWRLGGCQTGENLRSSGTDDRYCPLRATGLPGDETETLPFRRKSILDSGQRLISSGRTF